MRVKMVAGMLVGSVVVAVACSAQHALDNPSDKDGGALDALLDVVSADTKDALAGGGSSVDELKCDVLVGSVAKSWFAERTFPGRVRSDLARGVALVCKPKPDADGYQCQQVPMDVKDGAVRVVCAPESLPGYTAIVSMPAP